ncbi:MAG: hypothetical protein R3B72_33540 [Polyangiaceae bacterium]
MHLTVQTRPTPPPVVVVLDDDPVARRRLARLTSAHAITRPVASIGDALQALGRIAGALLVTELRLEREDPLRWLGRLADDAPPTLAVSATTDLTLVSQASGLGIPFVSKDEADDVLGARIAKLIDGERRQRLGRCALAERLTESCGLTAAESDVVQVFVATGGSRQALAVELGIAETSVRSRVRGACRKLGIDHLHEVYRLLLEALLPQPAARVSTITPSPLYG